MENLIKTTKWIAIILTLAISLPPFAFSQRYVISDDAAVKGRKLITFSPIVQRRQVQNLSANILETPSRSRRQPIQYVPFQMINPRTNRPIAPDAKLSLKLPNGEVRNFTAQQFFDQLNALEQSMNQAGRTLRDPDAFKDLRAEPINKIVSNAPPVLPNGYSTFKFSVAKSSNNNPFSNTALAQTITSPSMATLMKAANLDWFSKLYVADVGETTGTNEFPATWVAQSLPSTNSLRTIFPLLIQVTDGFEGLAAKAIWQVSEQPFTGTSQDKIISSGETSSLGWAKTQRGVSTYMTSAEELAKSKFGVVYANVSNVQAPPKNTIKNLYARVLLINAAGETVKITNPIILSYGFAEAKKVYVPFSTYANTPYLNYDYPSDKKIPFGVFLKGPGIKSVRTQIGSDEGIKPVGYKVEAGAAIGLRYFNFLSLVNTAEPSSKELELIKGDFVAISGNSTSSSGQNEPNGVSLNVRLLDGLVTEKIPLTNKTPTGAISLNYKLSQSLDIDLVNIRFTIGPVPVAIRAGIGGEAGLEIQGTADLVKQEVIGSINPYISSRFDASGGVDAFIAYATLNAKLDPLLYIGLPMSFRSDSPDKVFMDGKLKGLYGTVYLKVGFYYPCPDLGKVVGWLTGDEEVPLCECNWEYNIFQLDGFEHDFNNK